MQGTFVRVTPKQLEKLDPTLAKARRSVKEDLPKDEPDQFDVGEDEAQAERDDFNVDAFHSG